MRKINKRKFAQEERAFHKKSVEFGSRIFYNALKINARNFLEFDESVMQSAYLKFYESIMIQSAKRNLKFMRDLNRKDFIADSFFLGTFRNWIGEYIANDVVVQGLIRNVNDTTRRKIGEAIGKALEQGLSTDQIADYVFEIVANKSRAMGIAMTEATRANAIGKLRSAEAWQADTGTTLWKLWVHSDNPNEPRLEHIALQNKPVRKEEPFENGLMLPGDASGPPEETIRCMCSIVYVSEAYVERYYPDFV